MNDDTNSMYTASVPADRPSRWWQLAPKLRALAGTREQILAPLPSERPRYTAMGTVVLGTALMAMLAMGITLLSVFGKFQPITIPIVLVWGGFILGLDRYLMATVTTPRKAVFRISLAVAFGVIIAEGLLLGLFHTAIVERVNADRTAVLTSRESALLRCNPIPDVSVAVPAGCEGLRLQVPVTNQPDVLQKQLADDTAQRDALKPIVDQDATNYANLEAEARKECDGVSGQGLTGIPGVGYECTRLRDQ